MCWKVVPTHVGVELNRNKLLKGEVRQRRKKNVVQGRSFADMLEKSIQAYRNKGIEAHEVIDELIQMARDMRDAQQRGQRLGLNEDEDAFYDALATNKSAVQVMGDKHLAVIAQELVENVRQNVTIDWAVREAARAKMRVMVKRILKKHGYPPDFQEEATKTVLEQAEALCADWAA